MADFSSPSSDIGDNKLGLAQMFVEAKNIDFLKGGTAWIGKRFFTIVPTSIFSISNGCRATASVAA
ncbi:carbohydrate porin [Undibacterium arcticum]